MSQEDVIVRRARVDDAVAIAEIVRAVGWMNYAIAGKATANMANQAQGDPSQLPYCQLSYESVIPLSC